METLVVAITVAGIRDQTAAEVFTTVILGTRGQTAAEVIITVILGTRGRTAAEVIITVTLGIRGRTAAEVIITATLGTRGQTAAEVHIIAAGENSSFIMRLCQVGSFCKFNPHWGILIALGGDFFRGNVLWNSRNFVI